MSHMIDEYMDDDYPRASEELGLGSLQYDPRLTASNGPASKVHGSLTCTDDLGSFSVPRRLDMLKGDLAVLLAEQQAEHEKRLACLLEVHHRQIMEAVKGEVVKAQQVPASPGAGASERMKWTRISEDAVVASEMKHEISGGCSLPLQKHSVRSVDAPLQIHSKGQNSMQHAESAAMGWSSASMSDHARFTLQSLKTRTEELNLQVQASEETALAKSFNHYAGRLIRHSWFEGTVCALVALNAISIGAHADWTIKNLDREDEPVPFVVIDLAFAALFLMEFMLRVAGEGWYYLEESNRNRGWNMLDVVLVLSILVEEILSLFLISIPNVTIMRLLRMLRTVRAVRIFRVARFFTDLRLMVMGLVFAAKSLFWVIILLLFVMYIFAVCLMEITAENIAAQAQLGTKGVGANDEVLNYIGSLQLTMFTMYKSVCGGLDWGVVADELGRKGAFVAVLYSTYIAFATLCILNIVTGVFVQNATTIAQKDQIEMGLEHLESRRQWLNEVMELFKQGDVEGTGQIDWQHFKALATKPSVQACFTKLGIDLESINIRGLFCLFDYNNDGRLDLEEFATGIMKLHGVARSFDLHILTNLNKRILRSSKHAAQGGGPTHRSYNRVAEV